MSAFDFGARGLASQAALRIAAEARRARLRRLISRAATFNASDAVAMSGPPTVTALSAATGGALGVAYTVTANPTLFTLYGGIPARDGSGNLYGGNAYWRVQSVTLPSGGNCGVATGAQGVAMRVGFRTDAPSFDITMLGQASTVKIRFLVDGQYVDKTGLSTITTSGANYFNMTFTGARRMRRIDIEYEKDGAFYQIKVGAGDTVQPVAVADRYRIGVIGDSVTAATGATRSADGYAFHAGRRLGNMDLDMIGMGIGGTGICNPGTSPGVGSWTFGSHIADLTLQPLDEVWIANGANDQGYTSAQVTGASLALYQAVRLRCPVQPVIVLGGFVGGGGNSLALATETATKAAFDQWADPNSAFIPFNLATPKLQTGNSTAPTAGNYQFYGQGTTDTTHPSDIGHDYIGAYVAEARRQIAL